MSTKTTSLTTIKTETEKNSNSENEYVYCLRCGRKLKNPENKIRGMGRVCWEKSRTDKQRRLF